MNGLRATSDVILADVGGAAGGDPEYHEVKFEALLAGERQMGIAMHNIGRSEAAFGPAYLRDVAKRLNVPLISTNVRDARDGQPIAEASRVVTAGGRRVLLVGVMSPKFVTPSLQVSEPKQAVLDAAAAKNGSYDSLVVLAYLPQDELEQLASSLPEADAVIGGPTGQAMAPRKVGPTLLAAATNKGKFLIELSAPVASATGAWDGTVVEMSASYADDPAQQAGVKTYLATLEANDFPASQTGLGLPLPPGVPADYKVAGSAACMSCHPQDNSIWAYSNHAHAWDTIQAKGFHVDSYCQSCHTTGFGLPGGFETSRRPSDGFVVSRAVIVLRDAQASDAIEPLVKAAERRPELAPDVVRALSQQGAGTFVTISHLRKFCAHPNPAVRAAAAIRGVVEALPQGAGDDLKKALQDETSQVRLAAAGAVMQAIVKLRPNPEEEVTTGGGGKFLIFGNRNTTTTRRARDMEKWLTEFRGDAGRPSWTAELIEPLEKVLAGNVSNPAPAERIAAAVPLVALGKDDNALPVIQAAARQQNAADRRAASAALPWMPWAQRAELFKDLFKNAGRDEVGAYVREFGELANPAAAELLWDILAPPSSDAGLVSEVHEVLRRVYLGNRHYDQNSIAAERKQALIDACERSWRRAVPTRRFSSRWRCSSSSRRPR